MIDVDNLCFSYPAQTEDTLHDLSFSIPKGEIFGFLGPSGSGKSTTQRLLIGLLKNYKGTLRVMDKDLAEWGHGYFEHIGVGFELPNHFPKLTGEENLKLFQSFYSKKSGTNGSR